MTSPYENWTRDKVEDAISEAEYRLVVLQGMLQAEGFNKARGEGNPNIGALRREEGQVKWRLRMLRARHAKFPAWFIVRTTDDETGKPVHHETVDVFYDRDEAYAMCAEYNLSERGNKSVRYTAPRAQRDARLVQNSRSKGSSWVDLPGRFGPYPE